MIQSLARRVAPVLCALWQREDDCCGNDSCRARAPLWRALRNQELRANGAWYCSPSCLAQRIFVDCSHRPLARHHGTRMPLGMILLAQGAISEHQLRSALVAQHGTHDHIGMQLTRSGLVDTRQVTAALATQWQCPFIENVGHLDARCSLIPLSLMGDCRMAAIAVRGQSILRIMFDGPIDHSALYAINRMLDCRTVPCIGSTVLLEELLCRAAAQARDVEVNFGHAAPDAIARTAASYAEELSGGEIRYVSFGGRLWMRIPRVSGAVNLVFSQRPPESERQPHGPTCHKVPVPIADEVVGQIHDGHRSTPSNEIRLEK